MIRQRVSLSLIAFALPLLFLASAGITVAHDTGFPHTHYGADESGVASIELGTQGFDLNALHSSLINGTPSQGTPTVILIVPVGEDSSALHWLLHAMQGTGYQELSDWNHRHMHWHGTPHTHDSGKGSQGGDPTVPLAQYD